MCLRVYVMVSVRLSFANCISRFLFKAICFTNNNARHTSVWDGMPQTNSYIDSLFAKYSKQIHIALDGVRTCVNTPVYVCVLNKQNMNF